MDDERLLELTRAAADHPDDWQLQLELLAGLEAARRLEQAAALRRTLEARFRDQPDVLVHVALPLADRRDEDGRAHAARLLSRALELEPAHDLARSTLFSLHLERGDLTAAERLVTDDSPELRELLDDARRAPDRERAPAAPIPGEAPPARAGSRRVTPLSVAGGLVALVVGAVVLNHVLAAASRPLHVVNGTPGPATVRVLRDGVPVHEATVPAGERAVLTVGEGVFALEVQHAWGQETVTADLRRGLRTRTTARQELVVLNVAGAAALLVERMQYVPVFPNGQEKDAPATYTAELASGASLVRVPDVDFAFRDWPEQLPMDRGASPLRTRVSHLACPPSHVLEHVPDVVPVEQVLAHLERWLERVPGDGELTQVYEDLARTGGHEGRAAAFLQRLGR